MNVARSGKRRTQRFGPWNPGLESAIPARLLPLSTMFRIENVETGFQEAHELADFSGLKPMEIVAFRTERLIVHELLIKVTADLSVPDGSEYEELGLNLRNMTATLFEHHVRPHLGELRSRHEVLVKRAREFIAAELEALNRRPDPIDPGPKHGVSGRILGWIRKKQPSGLSSEIQAETALQDAFARWSAMGAPFEAACGRALRAVTGAIVGNRGDLPADKTIVIDLAANLFSNDHCSAQLGLALTPIVEKGARAEGYRILPPQREPFVLNVKGASAAGKSTIRPHQRLLADRLGIPWEDFALVSPDYWRKYLLDYRLLGPDYKYGAMLTGHELEIVDRKLDRYMAEKADRATMPHLLIDRFRFDSFNMSEDGLGINLLTRFGHTVFMFFMVTPPEATVERAWNRGLSTGRYKAVEDLLDHNIEAYTGMPALFFAWALSDKKVHFEFLDNSVAMGKYPRTIASGWNRRLIVFDIEGMLNIDRFTKINIHAAEPAEVLLSGTQGDAQNLEFVRQCCNRLDLVQFADPATGKPYAIVDHGRWIWMKNTPRSLAKRTAGILRMAGFDLSPKSGNPASVEVVEERSSDCLIGEVK
jgi:hypothetical protein